jgi:hypothetical protein
MELQECSSNSVDLERRFAEFDEKEMFVNEGSLFSRRRFSIL